MMDKTTAIPTAILTPTGVIPTPYTAHSLADAIIYEPDGVYTVGRTYQRTQTVLFDDHLARLSESAALEGITVALDRAAIRAALLGLIERGGFSESRFRLTVPRAMPDHLYLSVEPLLPVSPEVIAMGVRVTTTAIQRHNPRAKHTGWMKARREALSSSGDSSGDSSGEALPPYEMILTSADGFLLEGATSNFYAVAMGVLHTAGEGVLPGMAQKIVYQVAPGIIPLEKTPVRADQLWAIEEAFLTSASRGVIPITQINSQIIGTGQPGAVTLALRSAYEAWVLAHLDPL